MDLRYNINENGNILVWVISQTFPLGDADQEDKLKFMHEDECGYRRDIDFKALENFFEVEKFPAKVKFALKLNESFEEFQNELKELDKDASDYQCFMFVFLTYSKPVCEGQYDEEKLHFNHKTLEEGLVPQAKIIDEIKNLKVTKGKPKILLIQADDLSLLEEKRTALKAVGMEPRPTIKIPTDSDQLIIKSIIPQRPHKANHSSDPQQNVEQPSLLIQAFLEAMKGKDTTDLLTLTTTINGHVAEMVEKSDHSRKADLQVPLVTSTLTKLLYFQG